MKTKLEKIQGKEAEYNLTFICKQEEAAAILKICYENIEKIKARIKVFSGMNTNFIENELKYSIGNIEKELNSGTIKEEGKKYLCDELKSLPPEEIKIRDENRTVNNKKTERSNRGKDIDKLSEMHKKLF